MDGMIDTHCHLLPGVDDGCKSVDESIACARLLVGAGYSRAVCTPHIWSSLRHNTRDEIPRRVAALQRAYDDAGVALRLYPGGEHNLTELRGVADARDLITYNLAGRHVIADVWADEFPAYAWDRVRWMQDAGLTVILAHPERMRPVQEDPGLIDLLVKAGVLLQGNLQCFGDPDGSPTRTTAERLLRERRYFMLGSDTHNLATMPVRLSGLEMARALAGDELMRELTVENPNLLVDS